ncbi:MAG: 3TM-type holin [Desulfovibrionaceae bacterium]
MIGEILSLGSTILDKLFPDAGERDRQKLRLVELERAGELKELETRYAAIVAEAQSSDPWTSRARPGFLYVMYLLFLASIPFGVVAVFCPDKAATFQQYVSAWFNGLPPELYTLFGAGYLGYSGMRSWDKRRKP